MSNTISLEELKNLSLPCLPKNLESIRYRAKTQDWPYIEEVGTARGGRLKKYLIASLPAENVAQSQTGDGNVGSSTGGSGKAAERETTVGGGCAMRGGGGGVGYQISIRLLCQGCGGSVFEAAGGG